MYLWQVLNIPSFSVLLAQSGVQILEPFNADHIAAKPSELDTQLVPSEIQAGVASQSLPL